MEFESWLRGQLESAASPAPPRRGAAAVLQGCGAVVAGIIIWTGLSLAPLPSSPRLALLTHADQDLPVSTWEGTPRSPLAVPAVGPSAQPTGAEPSSAPSRIPSVPPSLPPRRQPEPAHGTGSPAAATGPAGTQQPGPSAAPAQEPATSQTFQLTGGTVKVTCRDSQLTLDSATANPGFTTETEWQDGGSTLRIRFRSSNHESQLEAWCSAGQVQGQAQEQST